MDLQNRLRQTLRKAGETQQAYEIVKPKLDALKEQIHAEWERSTTTEMDTELKSRLRSIVLLERLFMRDINAGKQARSKLGEDDNG